MKQWKRYEFYSGDYVYSKYSGEYRMVVLSVINNMARCRYLDVETSTVQTYNYSIFDILPENEYLKWKQYKIRKEKIQRLYELD